MMLRSFLLLLCLTISAVTGTAVAGVGSPGTDIILDSFQYGSNGDGNTDASPWKSNGEKSLLSTTQSDGQQALTLSAPFAAHSDWDRVYIDRSVSLDLSVAKRFVLEVEPNELTPFGDVTLYFRSKGGWYSCYGGFGRHGRQKLVFNKEDFNTEGTPAGWDQINGIRIAFWQGQSKDGQVTLHRLSVPKSPVLIVTGVTSAKNRDDQKEAKYAKEAAGRFERLASEGQIEAERTDEESLAALDLTDYQVVVLPYNPQLPPEARDQLIKYVDGGGKLFVCYQLDPKLGEAIGFQPGPWKRATRDGGFAEIRFTPKSGTLPGVPQVVKQNSWNINRATASGHNARTVGMWFDDAGQPTNEAALLISDRGAYLSHIILGDDPENKTGMIEAVLGKLSPSLWKNLAEKRLESLAEIGHDGPAQTEAWIQEQAVPRAIAELDKSKRLAAKAAGLITGTQVTDTQDKASNDTKAYYQAANLAKEACQAKAKAYLFSQRSPKLGQRRGFWNHSGLGAYPGDWDRTMREMSAAGFNAVFPNMCWGGCAHYPSDVLPESKTYEKYGDQIAQAVAAGKKYGVEVHVWKVNHYLSHRTPREFVEKLRSEGRLLKGISGNELDWLCPSHPKNFELERDAMLEVVKKYDVDGIHFDYIRYKSGEYCYCDGCRKRFEAASGRAVENWPQDCYSGSRKDEYHDWRCSNITRLVKAVHDGVQTINPKVKVSAAVFSNYPSCRLSVAQDWVLWAKSGYVDFLCPMDYQPNELSFENTVARQLKQVDAAVPLCPGIGGSHPRLMTPDQVAAQIFLTERLGAGGFTIFNLSPREAKTLFPAFQEAKQVRAPK